MLLCVISLYVYIIIQLYDYIIRSAKFIDYISRLIMFGYKHERAVACTCLCMIFINIINF